MSTAASRALKLYPGSTTFQAVYVKGAEAARAGKPKSACSYEGKTGWSFSYRMAWMRGWYSVSGVVDRPLPDLDAE